MLTKKKSLLISQESLHMDIKFEVAEWGKRRKFA